MTEVMINGRRTTVSDNFLSLSPEEQQNTIDEIAATFDAPEQKPAPQGYEIVDTFSDGGRIMRDAETGQEVYVDAGGASTDPNTIAMMRYNKGNVGENQDASVFAAKGARDVVAEGVGEGGLRFLSAMKGMPFLRGYVEPLAAVGATNRAGVEQGRTQLTEGLAKQALAGRQMEAPSTVAASRLATGIGAGAAAIPVMPAASIGGQMLQGAFIGAPAAALEGLIAGYGEGGREEANKQAAAGAVAGALGGLAAPAIGAGAGWAGTKYLSGPVRDIMEKIGFKDDAAKVAQDFLALDSAEAVANASRMGPYGSISSTGGATEALLDTVANSPEGRKIVIDNLNETASVASKDLFDSIDTVIGKPFGDLKGQQAKIMSDTAAGRRELYGSAYDFELQPSSESAQEVIGLMNSVSAPSLKKAQNLLQEGREAYEYMTPKVLDADTFNDIPSARRSKMNVTSNPDGTYTVQDMPTVATVDYVTRSLFGEAEALARAGDTIAANSKRDLAFKLRSALDDVNPDYAAARASGKDAIDQRAAAEIGDQILNPKMTRAEVERSLSVMDDTAQKQLKQAIRNRIDEVAANAKVNPTGNNDAEIVESLATLKALNSRAVADKLRMVLGDDAADTLGEQINATSEALMHRASVATNSKTAIRGLVNERMKDILGENVGETVARQGLLPTVTGAVTGAVVGGPSQRARVDAVSRELAPILTQRLTPQKLQENARMMEMLAPAIGRARRGGEAVGNVAQRTMMGAGQVQAGQGEDSRVRDLMRTFGIMNQQ